MSLVTSRDALVRAAAGWDGVAGELEAAYLSMPLDLRRGEAFGARGQETRVTEEHDLFVPSMSDALEQGMRAMTDLANALRETARDFGATDTDVADSFHTPEGTPAR